MNKYKGRVWFEVEIDDISATSVQDAHDQICLLAQAHVDGGQPMTMVDSFVHTVHEDDETGEFLRWLAAMDDPGDEEGKRNRQTVTLTQIIDRAKGLGKE